MKRLVLAMVSVAFFGFGQAAMAGEYAMSYSADELSSAPGVQDVHKRIVRTAKRYCPSSTKIRDAREARSCIADVVNDLVNKVDHPRLTSYHVNDGSVRVAATAARDSDNS